MAERVPHEPHSPAGEFQVTRPSRASQCYAFDIVAAAIRRCVLVIEMRSSSLWSDAGWPERHALNRFTAISVEGTCSVKPIAVSTARNGSGRPKSHSRGPGFDPPRLHQETKCPHQRAGVFIFSSGLPRRRHPARAGSPEAAARRAAARPVVTRTDERIDPVSTCGTLGSSPRLDVCRPRLGVVVERHHKRE